MDSFPVFPFLFFLITAVYSSIQSDQNPSNSAAIWAKHKCDLNST